MNDELLFDSSVPLYLQLEQMLLNDIKTGVLPSGSRLPTEFALSDTYHVSRVTVRKALLLLEEGGYIERKIGKGTYVANRKLQRKLTGSVSSFSNMCREMGTTPSSKTIRKEIILPGENDRLRLGLAAGDHAVLIERIRYSDNEPVMIERDYFSTDFEFLLDQDLDNHSLYKTIEEARGVSFSASSRTIDIVFATGPEAEALGLRTSYPLLRISSLTQDERGENITLSEQLCVGDKFKLQV